MRPTTACAKGVTAVQQKSDLPDIGIAADTGLGGRRQIGMKMRGKEFDQP
jgi:hypothetical protein